MSICKLTCQSLSVLWDDNLFNATYLHNVHANLRSIKLSKYTKRGYSCFGYIVSILTIFHDFCNNKTCVTSLIRFMLI